MTQKITSKITDWKVAEPVVPTEPTQDSSQSTNGKETSDVVYANPDPTIYQETKADLKRPLRLDNEWRLKPPYAEHALYVRLNSIEHNGRRYPYELFFNTKDAEQEDLLRAYPLLLSVAFRGAITQGTSLIPYIENLKACAANKGGYWSKVTECTKLPYKPKRTYVKGLLAEVGLVIETFIKECEAWNREQSGLVIHEKPFHATMTATLAEGVSVSEGKFVTTDMLEPARLNVCPSCSFPLSKKEGCDSCNNCGYSKCG